MEPALVDTDVVSYLFKRDTRRFGYETILDDRVLLLSFMTVAELRLWARSRDWGAARRNDLDRYVADYTILPWSDAVCTVWAEVTHGARRVGRRIQTADAWIVATAIQHGLPLVTHNPDDYAGVESLRLLTA